MQAPRDQSRPPRDQIRKKTRPRRQGPRFPAQCYSGGMNRDVEASPRTRWWIVLAVWTVPALIGVIHSFADGELEGDTILESEYILCLQFLGRTYEDGLRKAANFLRQQQLADSAWSIYPGTATDVSASVKASVVMESQKNPREMFRLAAWHVMG